MTGIAFNDNQQIDIRVVGTERTPVLVIDRPFDSADDLLAAATSDANFLADRRFAYPGIRAELPDSYVDALVPDLLERLRDVYEIPIHLEHRIIHRLYSLITTPPEDLGVLQRVPHFDTLNSYYFATVHYLAPGPFAGTGIFRHRPTGFERISEDRYPAYVEAAESHMKAHGLPDARYIDSSTDHYELIEELEYQQNRLIVYPGNLLHSGLIQPERDVSWDPATGRLTANLFIDFVEPGSA
jgi:hypothetical protein